MSLNYLSRSFIGKLFVFVVSSLCALIFVSMSFAQISQPVPPVPVFQTSPTKALVVYGFSTGNFGPYGINYAVGSIPGTFTTYPLEQNMGSGSLFSNPYTSGNDAYIDYLTSDPTNSYSLVKQARISLSNPAIKTVTTLPLPPITRNVSGFSTTLGRNALNHPSTFGVIVEDMYPVFTYVLEFFQYDHVTSTLQTTLLTQPISLQLSAQGSV